MRRTRLSGQDIAEALRMQGRKPHPSSVRLACLERNGGVSVLPFEDEPRIVSVPAEDGVQTIRIELR